MQRKRPVVYNHLLLCLFSSKIVFQVNIKTEAEEPEPKRSHFDEDEQGDMIAAEILFKKISSDIGKEIAECDDLYERGERLVRLLTDCLILVF